MRWFLAQSIDYRKITDSGLLYFFYKGASHQTFSWTQLFPIPTQNSSYSLLWKEHVSNMEKSETWTNLVTFLLYKSSTFYQYPPTMLLFLLIAFEYGFYEGEKRETFY